MTFIQNIWIFLLLSAKLYQINKLNFDLKSLLYNVGSVWSTVQKWWVWLLKYFLFKFFSSITRLYELVDIYTAMMINFCCTISLDPHLTLKDWVGMNRYNRCMQKFPEPSFLKNSRQRTLIMKNNWKLFLTHLIRELLLILMLLCQVLQF